MYTIYHIEGVKIGCSKNPKRRVKGQGYSAFQVLEVHEDIDVASKREIELQIEYGYGRDCTVPYNKTIKIPTSKGGINSVNLNNKNNHFSKLGKISGPISCAIERTCPWCFRIIKGPNYFKWHGDRCKFAW